MIKTLAEKKFPHVFFILLLAYILRIFFPQLFMTGGDLPGHIMASMRLSHTSPFNFSNTLENSFAQLFQFGHGYTTMLMPFILYFFSFRVLGIVINESSLVFANSLLGIASLFSIYYFLKININKKISLLALLILAVLPVHIGLSRAHVGTQIIQSTFFFLSLAFLSRSIKENKNHLKILYFILTALYIGADNLFFIGLFFHVLFIYIFISDSSKEAFIQNLKKTYFSYHFFIFIALPITAYIIVTLYSLNHGIQSGYLIRTFFRTTDEIRGKFTFNPLTPLLDSLLLIGPIFILFLVSLSRIKHIVKNNIIKFFLAYFILYFILMIVASSTVEKNYVMFLIVPSVVISLMTLYNSEYFTIFYTIILLLTSVYSASVVYGLDIGFTTISNYGSVNKNIIRDNDYGVKTIGYLVRSGEINVSKIHAERYGFEVEEAGVYIGYEGAYYYLGDLPVENKQDLEKFDNFIIVYLTYWNNDGNQDIPFIASTMNLSVAGYIRKNNLLLATIYSNNGDNTTKTYDANYYNKKFDQEFGRMGRLVKISLGHY